MRLHVAAIVQAGERVGDRHLDRLVGVVAQPLGVALLLDLRAHARQHFVLVDRADQVIVDADFQAAHQPLVVVGFGHRQDRHVAGALERADLAAQAQAVEILQAERDDQQVEIAFGRAEQRFVRIGFHLDRMLGRQGRDDALIGGRPVVDDENFPVAAGVRHGIAFRALDADFLGGVRAHAQFVGHHLQARQRAHARDQRHVGDRLGEEIVGAGFQAAHAVGRLVERGHHDDRNMMGRRVRLELAADLEAVHVRHHHVEQHDVAFGALAQRQRLGPASGGGDVEIFRRQPRFQQLHIGRDVVDDKNAGGHRCTITPGPGNDGSSR